MCLASAVRCSDFRDARKEGKHFWHTFCASEGRSELDASLALANPKAHPHFVVQESMGYMGGPSRIACQTPDVSFRAYS